MIAGGWPLSDLEARSCSGRLVSVNFVYAVFAVLLNVVRVD